MYRHLPTDSLHLDVQPTYLRCHQAPASPVPRLTINSKVFQLRLPHEVAAERSTARRSQTTGYLVVTLPRCGDSLSYRVLFLTPPPLNLAKSQA